MSMRWPASSSSTLLALLLAYLATPVVGQLGGSGTQIEASPVQAIARTARSVINYGNQGGRQGGLETSARSFRANRMTSKGRSLSGKRGRRNYRLDPADVLARSFGTQLRAKREADVDTLCSQQNQQLEELVDTLQKRLVEQQKQTSRAARRQPPGDCHCSPASTDLAEALSSAQIDSRPEGQLSVQSGGERGAQPGDHLEVPQSSQLELLPNGQLGSQSTGEPNAQPGDLLGVPASSQLGFQPSGQLNLQSRGEREAQPNGQLDIQPGSQLEIQPDGQLAVGSSQPSDELNAQANSGRSNQPSEHLGTQMIDQIGKELATGDTQPPEDLAEGRSGSLSTNIGETIPEAQSDGVLSASSPKVNASGTLVTFKGASAPLMQQKKAAFQKLAAADEAKDEPKEASDNHPHEASVELPRLNEAIEHQQTVEHHPHTENSGHSPLEGANEVHLPKEVIEHHSSKVDPVKDPKESLVAEGVHEVKEELKEAKDPHKDVIEHHPHKEIVEHLPNKDHLVKDPKESLVADGVHEVKADSKEAKQPHKEALDVEALTVADQVKDKLKEDLTEKVEVKEKIEKVEETKEELPELPEKKGKKLKLKKKPQKTRPLFPSQPEMTEPTDHYPLYRSPKLKDLHPGCRVQVYELEKQLGELLNLLEHLGQTLLLDRAISYERRLLLSRHLAKLRSAGRQTRLAANLANMRIVKAAGKVVSLELRKLSGNPIAVKLEPSLHAFALRYRNTFSALKKVCRPKAGTR